MAKIQAKTSKPSKVAKTTEPISKTKSPKSANEKKKTETKKEITEKVKTTSKKIVKEKTKVVLLQTDSTKTQAVIASIEEKLKKAQKSDDKIETAIEKKLLALINLQLIDSQIDKIRIIRGELPLEVQDLEDEIAGIQTRIENLKNEATAHEESITDRKNATKQCLVLIKKYEAQLSNVRNNREYESLSKEVEFQNLEIQLSEKRIKEFKASLDIKKESIEISEKLLAEKIRDLELKNSELSDIVTETEKEESILFEKSQENQKIIEERLLAAYIKIRKNARNGLAVVMVERDACGGCFNKIPPQRQLDIRMHKKIIVCEYCGRILVDSEIANP